MTQEIKIYLPPDKLAGKTDTDVRAMLTERGLDVTRPFEAIRDQSGAVVYRGWRLEK